MFFRDRNREMNKAEVSHNLKTASITCKYLAGVMAGRMIFPERQEYIMYSISNHRYSNREFIADFEDLSGRNNIPEKVNEDVFLNTICTRTGIPRWVNLSVYETTSTSTVMMANICSDQVSTVEKAMFKGSAPFHIVSPTFPAGYEWGKGTVILPTR